jgi:hypothetical protein
MVDAEQECPAMYQNTRAKKNQVSSAAEDTSERAAREPTAETLRASAAHRELKLAIEYVPIGTVKAYHRKLRKPSEQHEKMLTQNIRANGLVLPLLIDGDSVLIDGHAVLAMARKLGYEEVPVVRTAHLSVPQVQALRIALNRLPELNAWDYGELALELGELLPFHYDGSGFDIEQTGFALPEADRIMSLAGEAAAAGDSDEEEVPEPDPSRSPLRAWAMSSSSGPIAWRAVIAASLRCGRRSWQAKRLPWGYMTPLMT